MIDPNKLEEQLKDSPAPRITKADIDALMSRVTYKLHAVGTSTFVHAFLDNHFYLATGHSACVNPANYNAQVGADIAESNAKENAIKALWAMEGYALYKATYHG